MQFPITDQNVPRNFQHVTHEVQDGIGGNASNINPFPTSDITMPSQQGCYQGELSLAELTTKDP